MPDRTQDLKNLRAVATACKNYTDKVADDLRWELGTYDLSVDSVDGITMLLPTPADATQMNINKVEGNSEVSENKYTVNPQPMITLSGGGERWIGLGDIPIVNGKTYTIKFFNTRVANEVVQLENYSYATINYSQTYTFTANTDFVRIRIGNGNLSGDINYQLKMMIVEGSTAPTEFKVGFDGIHNLELSGLKVEGANFVDIPNTTNNTISFTDNIEGNWFGRIWKSPYSALIATITTAFSDGDYNKTFTLDEDTTIRIQLGNGTFGRWTKDIPLKKGTYTISLTFKATSTTVTFSYIRLNRGSTALPYQPYVQPTTIPIDLTTIEDSGGNKLFADGSLNGVGNVYDEVTPYKAIKRFGIVDMGTLNYSMSISNNRYLFSTNNLDVSPQQDANVAIKAISTIYNAVQQSVTWVDKNMSYNGAVGTTIVVFINNDYTSAEAFKNAMSGVYLYYELATPIEVSIDWSDKLLKQTCYSNGTTTLQNTNNQDTTSQIDYLIEEVKA